MERAIFVSLGLMLAYTVFVLVSFQYRYSPACDESHAFAIESGYVSQRYQRNLAAVFSPRLGTLKGISLAAPMLGLAGTSYGILAALSFGYSGPESRFLALISSRIAFALVTALLGILVAIPAIFSHNFLRARVAAESRMPLSKRSSDLGSFRFAQTLPLKRCVSAPPAFALIAVPSLAGILAMLVALGPYEGPMGLSVGLVRENCQDRLCDRLIVLSLTDTGKLLINSEPADWDSLPERLSAIYRLRKCRTLYIHAEDKVAFQSIADAIDRTRDGRLSPLNIMVRLITPQAETESAVCLLRPTRSPRSGVRP